MPDLPGQHFPEVLEISVDAETIRRAGQLVRDNKRRYCYFCPVALLVQAATGAALVSVAAMVYAYAREGGEHIASYEPADSMMEFMGRFDEATGFGESSVFTRENGLPVDMDAIEALAADAPFTLTLRRKELITNGCCDCE